MKPRNPQQSERPRETGTASIWSVTLSAVSILTVTDEVGSFLRRNAARNLERASSPSSRKTQILVQALLFAGSLMGGAVEGGCGGQGR